MFMTGVKIDALFYLFIFLPFINYSSGIFFPVIISNTVSFQLVDLLVYHFFGNWIILNDVLKLVPSQAIYSLLQLKF